MVGLKMLYAKNYKDFFTSLVVAVVTLMLLVFFAIYSYSAQYDIFIGYIRLLFWGIVLIGYFYSIFYLSLLISGKENIFLNRMLPGRFWINMFRDTLVFLYLSPVYLFFFLPVSFAGYFVYKTILCPVIINVCMPLLLFSHLFIVSVSSFFFYMSYVFLCFYIGYEYHFFWGCWFLL